MKYIDEFRNPEIITTIKNKIFSIYDNRPLNFMEVCGGHTHAICKFGIKKLLPEGINLLSGPGCPVCVTENNYIDKAVELSRREDTIIATFGDMVKVPGSKGSLETNRHSSESLHICYSSMDALRLAEADREKEIIFLGVGFETTAPSIAATIIEARKRKLDNFSVLAGNKTMPEAMRTLLDAGDVRIDGFICPGHVSTVTGTNIYDFIPNEYNVPCVISGFEPIDIMESIYLLSKQIINNQPLVENQYKRSVKAAGNQKALHIMYEVFENCDSIWRGLGNIPGSGLRIRENYRSFDADHKFRINITGGEENKDCICGSIMRGINKPPDCKLFKTLCTPENPVGPCMVSSEGACSAFYKYEK